MNSTINVVTQIKMVEPDHFSILCLVGSLVRNATECSELFRLRLKRNKVQNFGSLSLSDFVFMIFRFVSWACTLSNIFKFMRQFKSTVMENCLGRPKGQLIRPFNNIVSSVW
jgi:hypothetical protein